MSIGLILRKAQHEEYNVILTLSLSKGEPRPAQPGKSVQWTDLSGERRELGRAAGANQ